MSLFDPRTQASPVFFRALLVGSLAGLGTWLAGCSVSRIQPDRPALRAASLASGVPPDSTFLCVFREAPAFPGGDRAMHAFIQRHRRYPPDARRANITGKVLVSFVIEPDGRLTHATVLRGLGHGTDEEAVRVMNAMPRWKPGRYGGKATQVRYNLPILFGLD